MKSCNNADYARLIEEMSQKTRTVKTSKIKFEFNKKKQKAESLLRKALIQLFCYSLALKEE